MKPKVFYLNVYNICGAFPYGRKNIDARKTSAENFKRSLIHALESTSDVVYVDFIDVIIYPGFSWIHEIFSNLTEVQKELVQQKLYIKIEYRYYICSIEKILGSKLVKHYEIQKEIDECKLRKNKLKKLLNRILVKIFGWN